MVYVVAGLVVLWLAHAGLRSLTRMRPADMVRTLKQIGIAAVLALAALLVLTGRFVAALGLVLYALIYLSRISRPMGFMRAGIRSAGAPRGPTSRVRSAMIEMELDHDSGAMRGAVLAGLFQDRALDSLTRPDCIVLLRECLRDDPEGARLLEAYLDRRFAGWRAAGQTHEDAGGGGDRRTPTGPMTENEAYEVLGLGKGASRHDITRAHRALMKKLHPDHGGSTHLAARANEAKDVLLRRHG